MGGEPHESFWQDNYGVKKGGWCIHLVYHLDECLAASVICGAGEGVV